MTEMVTSGSMSGEMKRSDGLLGERDHERRRLPQAPPVLHATASPRLYQQSVDGGPRGRGHPVLHRRAGPRATRLVQSAGRAAARLSQSSTHARSTRAPIDRQRGERIERSFAHLYDTGGMRRTPSAWSPEHSQAV